MVSPLSPRGESYLHKGRGETLTLAQGTRQVVCCVVFPTTPSHTPCHWERGACNRAHLLTTSCSMSVLRVFTQALHPEAYTYELVRNNDTPLTHPTVAHEYSYLEPMNL